MRAGAFVFLLVACGGRESLELVEGSKVSPPPAASRKRTTDGVRELDRFRLACNPDDVATGPGGGIVIACEGDVHGYSRNGERLWHVPVKRDMSDHRYLSLGTTPDGGVLVGDVGNVLRLDGGHVSWREALDIEPSDDFNWGVFGVGATGTGGAVAALNDDLAIVVAAFDGAGQALWSVDLYSADGGRLYGDALATRADGSSVVAGYDEEKFSNWRRFIALVDATGTLVWAHRQENLEGRDFLMDVAFAPNGGVLAVGARMRNGTNHGAAHAYDASGHVRWGAEDVAGIWRSVLVDDDGAAVIAGDSLVGLSVYGDETFRVLPAAVELPWAANLAWGALGEFWTWGTDEPGYPVAVRLAY